MDYPHFVAINLRKPSHLFPKKPFSPLACMLIVLQIEERILWIMYVVTYIENKVQKLLVSILTTLHSP